MSTEPGGRIVDAHVHVWSADTDRYPLTPGFDRNDLWLPSFTPEDHAQYSRAVGPVRMNLVQMTWYGLDHSYIADLIAQDPTDVRWHRDGLGGERRAAPRPGQGNGGAGCPRRLCVPRARAPG